MSLRWHAAVVDCHDVHAQSRWWAGVLGWRIAGEDGYGVVTVVPPEQGTGLMFQPVPEGHPLRNRLYLALDPDGDQAAEISRLQAMGAKVVAVGEGEVDWVIMQDPEGNGFSVLGPRSERPRG
jgi:Glyoxalase-like domain